MDHLNQGLRPGHKLTLISAPAGFGKTTLLSEWIVSVGPPVAWVSLDEGDNDPARFLAYLIAALKRVVGTEWTIGKGAVSMLQSPQPPPIEDVLTSLINDIISLSHRIILVLDDYYLLESPRVDETLAFFIEHLPLNMHLVIATRDDPQLPLARLRARGQLTELRALDLRFSSSEAAEFLNRVMGLALSGKDIVALETRTEGWIAGLQLAAISMQGKKDFAAHIDSFTGSHRFVMDYLIEEVLEQQSEGVQDFLLHTAVLTRMTGSLCDALTGQDNGQATLEMLEHANLFIVPLDENRRWYRYHHLFADLLRRRLNQKKADWVFSLHQQASTWFEQNGFNDEAIEHALHAQNFQHAAQLIEKNIDASWGHGEHKKWQRWLDELPKEMLSNSPRLSIFQARYQYTNGCLDEAEQSLRAAEQALNPGSDGASGTGLQETILLTEADRARLRGRAAATRALLCSYRGDVPGIIQFARQALVYLPDEDLTWRSATALVLGNAYGFQGDMRSARQARYKALQACEASGDIFLIMLANLQLAITLREQGRLQQTIEICERQKRFADEFGLSQSRAAGWLLAVWGETLAELNHLEAGAEQAEKGLALARSSGDLTFIGWGFMCLVSVLFSKGDLAGAEKSILDMQEIARDSNLPPWIANQVAAWQARIWLAQDRPDAANRWARERGLETGKESIPLNEIDFFSLFEYLVLARILIARRRLASSCRLLEQLLKAAEAGERTSSVIEILILQALTLQVAGNTDQAMGALARALTLGEPEGFVRVFIDEGRPMADLLQEAAARSIAPDYVGQLLSAFPTDAAQQTASSETYSTARILNSEYLDPLSERELEVLQYIAEGLSNHEIAVQMYLSPNTVKVHTRNIYSKLDVHARIQAVSKARELGILPSS
jgi:LuxR family maltose regulon positive regulatory protein